MPPEAYNAAADAIKNTNSVIQLLVWLLIGGTVCLVFWILKLSGDSKRLIAAKEAAEIERTARRKEARDAQVAGMGTRFDNEMKEVRALFAGHIEEHRKQDNAIHESIIKLEHRLCKIEDNVHSIDINIARMMIRMEMGETERTRHEQDK